MKERPILMNGDMVRSVLSGRKTQTRRPLRPQPILHPDVSSPFGEWTCKGHKFQWGPGAFPTFEMTKYCPFGQPGDRLWVRETFFKYWPIPGSTKPAALYRADGINLCELDSEGVKQRWTPSIHMPRELSRITLEITGISVDCVQDITGTEAEREGAHEVHMIGDGPSHPTWSMGGPDRYDHPRNAFRWTWDGLYAGRGLGWDVNPWVWVIKFKRVEAGKE